MPTSRATRLRSEQYNQNVVRRGRVPVGKIADRDKGFTVGPILLGFFLFVVVGSSLVQIIRSAQSSV